MQNVLAISIVLIAAGPVLAATPMPEIPSRSACDAHFQKKGDVKTRYGSMEAYLSCLLTGSAGTLVMEARRLSDTASLALEQLSGDSQPEVVVATVRNTRAMNNLSLATWRYLSNFLYQVEDEETRKLFCEFGELGFQKGPLIEELAGLRVNRLEQTDPEVAAAMKKSEATTKGFCQAKVDAYKEGRMSEPERNFVFPASYMSTVVACAEQDIDFYRLIDPEPHRVAVIPDEPFAEAMDALERINYHCHLHPPEAKD
ncbi:MAG: hypothetical protein NXI30_28855 [bacterium]|nr:hypothetical protein [bacterium]